MYLFKKSYFFKYLNLIKKPGLKSLSFKKISDCSNKVIKPDAPIYGKKNIYLVKDEKKFFFKKCQKESHNKKVNISNFYDGNDISSFYYSERRSKKSF